MYKIIVFYRLVKQSFYLNIFMINFTGFKKKIFHEFSLSLHSSLKVASRNFFVIKVHNSPYHYPHHRLYIFVLSLHSLKCYLILIPSIIFAFFTTKNVSHSFIFSNLFFIISRFFFTCVKNLCSFDFYENSPFNILTAQVLNSN